MILTAFLALSAFVVGLFGFGVSTYIEIKTGKREKLYENIGGYAWLSAFGFGIILAVIVLAIN